MKTKKEDPGTKEASQEVVKREITITGKVYPVAPPMVSTLIEVSELVAQMPQVKMNPDSGVTESLMIAKECRVLGDIVACMVFGEGIRTERRIINKKRFWGLYISTKTVEVDLRAELAKEALKMGPVLLKETVVNLLHGMEIEEFFGLATSLIEINLTKPTKEVA